VSAQIVRFAEDGGAFVSLTRHAARSAEISFNDVTRSLVAAAESWSTAHGVDYLQVTTADPAARTVFEEAGFVAIDPTRLVKHVERGYSVFPLHGIPELRDGDDLAAMILERTELEDGDVVVVAQKAISKIEGRVVRLDDAEPSAEAIEIAGDTGDPRRIEWILRESARVVRVREPLVITQTKHGFICASAGVDRSNTPEPGTLVLLPVDPDASAAALRETLRERTGRDVGVLVTDSFGRPWRQGTTDVAIGAAGIVVLEELSGARDPIGYELAATVIAIADELAGAAQLVTGKLDRIPVSVIRGLDVRGDGRATEIPIPPERDLFG
jgi:coenzyme F420-0:L-glutamate ligase / coenzyme F420-1:gamma-L-glutamate ligase